MFCTKCGTQLPDGSRVCSNCGADLTQGNDQQAQTVNVNIVQPVDDRKNSWQGITSFISGILSIVLCPAAILFGLIGTIFGIIGVCKKNTKKGLAIAGLVLSIFGGLIVGIPSVLILTGVMGPQLIKYTEMTNVSSDTQLCDSIKTAIEVGLMDPEVVSSDDFTQSAYFEGDVTELDAFGDTFVNAVEEMLGCGLDELDDKLNSRDAESICVIISGSQVTVYIPGSHADGKGGTEEISVY